MIKIFIAMRLLAAATTLDTALAKVPNSAKLSSATRFQYALFFEMAGEETRIDPFLLAAVAWHESDLENLAPNASNDIGLMQVHWQPMQTPGETWLLGLTKTELKDPYKNILAGARELAHDREFCRRLHHSGAAHDWWSHYRFGVVVPSNRYGRAIQGLINRLRYRPRHTS